MTLAEHNKCCEIIRELKAHAPNAGEVRIEPGLEAKANPCGLAVFTLCYWLHIGNPKTSTSFSTLDVMERYVHRKIHALKLLTVTTPTPEERYRKDCLRRMYGFYEEKEMN